MNPLGMLAAVDRLYEDVVTSPERWNDEAFADWVGEVASGEVERNEQRALRRVLRTAEKLARFWSDPAAPAGTDEWQSRVDVAMGARAWRPTLELALAGLERSPDPELFGEVQRRFRLVHSSPFLDGADFATWLAQRPQIGEARR